MAFRPSFAEAFVGRATVVKVKLRPAASRQPADRERSIVVLLHRGGSFLNCVVDSVRGVFKPFHVTRFGFGQLTRRARSVGRRCDGKRRRGRASGHLLEVTLELNKIGLLFRFACFVSCFLCRGFCGPVVVNTAPDRHGQENQTDGPPNEGRVVLVLELDHRISFAASVREQFARTQTGFKYSARS